MDLISNLVAWQLVLARVFRQLCGRARQLIDRDQVVLRLTLEIGRFQRRDNTVENVPATQSR
jgi:hypothetical protein